MIDTLMLEKRYYELMGYENVTECIAGGDDWSYRWLESGGINSYSRRSKLPTICWNTEQATNVMLRHKINVKFYEAGVEAWHNDGGSPTTVYYHRDKSTRAYFSDDEVFNVAVLQAAVEMLERKI